VTAFKHLGRNLTAYPKPIDDGELTERGAYSIVRHPIYSGVILCVAAWALVTCTISGAFAALIAFVFFDRKAAFEERFLINKYTGYAAYRQHVKKLIPFVY
jgi:protein-S-isoprenylcysteine O-methyltransferase Ste14